jgi:hypothetical protein
MKIWRWAVLFASLPFVFAAVGMGTGWGIGTWMPEYYRSTVNPRFIGPSFDPVTYGMGQGLTQGLVLGVIVAMAGGLLFSLIQAWRDHRTRLRELLDDLSVRLDHLQQSVSRLQDEVRALRGSPAAPETGISVKARP